MYVGLPPIDEDGYYQDAGYINPGLPVAEIGNDFRGDGFFTRTPNYASSSPVTRATYLDWLATRESTMYSTQYVMLYFLGLERRFFFDRSPRPEKLLILAEVERLLDIYAYDKNIEFFFGCFTSVARLLLGLDQKIWASTCKTHPAAEAVLAEIGVRANAGKRMDAKHIFNWYVVETKLPAAAHRVFPEYKALFIALFNKKCPNGITLHTSGIEWRSLYHAISLNFTLDLGDRLGRIGDVSEDAWLYRISDQIAEEALKSLEKFGRYLGKSPQRRKDMEAHVLLPSLIRYQFPCEEAEEILSWGKPLFTTSRDVRFDEVYQKVTRSSAERVTKSQTIRVIDKLASLFIGLAPDPRLTNRNLKLEDSVTLYELPESLDPVKGFSDNIVNSFAQLAIAFFVIQAKDLNAQTDMESLRNLTENKALTLFEKYQLICYQNWLRAVPPTLPLLRQVLKPLSQSAKQELAPVALSVAAVAGYAPPERVDAVKKIYRLLGLDAADVYSDLHSHTVGDGVTIVKPGSKEPQDFEILPDGESQTRFELDSQRIDSVMNDTVQVSKVLGEIFANDDQPLENEPSHDSDELLPGLHSQFALLALELIQRDYWQDDEFAQLAGRFDLMPDGALEILNEWAFEQFDEPLIEEYDGYNLNPGVLERLTAEGALTNE